MGAVEEYSKRSSSDVGSAKNVAVIFGVTGLVGKELLKKLLSKSTTTTFWKVYGIARRPDLIDKPIKNNPQYNFISCDLLDPLSTTQKLSSSLTDVTHAFWVTWASQFPLDSKECSDQNTTMMSNVLNVLLPKAKNLKHFSLQTGTKHYISLNAPPPMMKEVLVRHYYDEECPRIGSVYNFYYALEDLLRERLTAGKVAWSVHRPGLIMGNSQRTLYNFMGSLCVYGSICKHLNMPFVFGGTRECWEESCIDGSDARLVAEQHKWAAENDAVCNGGGGQAFNAVNGFRFTWKAIWPEIAAKMGAVVPAEEDMFSEDFVFFKVMGDKGGAWKEIVEKEGLVGTEMEDLANWGFLDALFRCPVKMLGTREKADRLGFTMRCHTLDSILHWVDVMRHEKIIP